MQGHTDRIEERVTKMLKAGRITEEEAERVRAAAAQGEADSVVHEIRLKHIKARVDVAVADGQLAPEEADTLLERAASGERPRFPRHRRGPRGRGSGGDTAHGSRRDGDATQP
jgi:hypothetical protein